MIQNTPSFLLRNPQKNDLNTFYIQIKKNKIDEKEYKKFQVTKLNKITNQYIFPLYYLHCTLSHPFEDKENINYKIL